MNNKKGILFHILYLFVFAVLTVLIVLRTRSIYGAEASASFSFYVILIISFVLSYLLASTLHELGHLVFAKFNGMKTNGLRILFLVFYKQDKKIKVSLSNNNEVAGSCEIYPTSSSNVESNYFWTTMGGTVFVGIYMAFCLLIFTIGSFINSWWLYLLISLQIPYSFFSFAINVTPINVLGRKTDGLIALELKRKEPSAFVACKSLEIQAEMYKGKMPGEIDRDIYFKAPQLPADDVQYAIITQLRCMYYLDIKNFDKAIKHYERLVEIYQEIPDEYAESVALELCYFYSALLNDVELAMQYYDVVEKQLANLDTPIKCRVSASYNAYVLKDKEGALDAIQKGEKVAKNYHIKGLASFELKLMNNIKADIDKGSL